MAMRALKRQLVDHRQRTRSQASNLSPYAAPATRIDHHDEITMTTKLTTSPSPADVSSARSSPRERDEKNSSPTVATSASADRSFDDGVISDDFRSKPQRTYQQIVTLCYNNASAAVQSGTSPAVGGAIGIRTNQLRPNRARTAAVIKAKYIRSIQQYRKVCSLIDMLVAQHSKLDTRRRQLQRTLGALSTMYRMNTIRSLGTTTTTMTDGPVIASPSAVSSSTSPLPPQPYQLVRSHRALNSDSVIDVDSIPEVANDFEYETEMMQASTLAAEDLSARWCVVDDIDAAYSKLPEHHPTELASFQRNSPPTIRTNAACYSRNEDLSCSSRASVARHSSRNDDFERIAEAHCKNNYIDIDVTDYERPAAAHTRKADLTSYSYLQLSRQRPV